MEEGTREEIKLEFQVLLAPNDFIHVSEPYSSPFAFPSSLTTLIPHTVIFQYMQAFRCIKKFQALLTLLIEM